MFLVNIQTGRNELEEEVMKTHESNARVWFHLSVPIVIIVVVGVLNERVSFRSQKTTANFKSCLDATNVCN